MPLFLWPDKVKLALTVYQWLDLCLLVSSDYWHSDMCWPQWDLYFSISLLLWTEKLNWQSNGGRWRDPCLLGGPGQARQWNDTTFWQWPFISDLTKRQWHVCMIYQNLSNKHAIEGTWTYHEVVFSLNFSWPSPTQCWLVRPPFFLNSPFVFKHKCQLHEPILQSTQSCVFPHIFLTKCLVLTKPHPVPVSAATFLLRQSVCFQTHESPSLMLMLYLSF